MARGRPSKSLADLVKDGTFLARRPAHRELLETSPDLPWAALADLQRQYREAERPRELQAIALDFEHTIRDVHQEVAERAASGDHERVLRTLGRPGSIARSTGIFPRFFRHYEGPRAGEPFELEAWQQRILQRFLSRYRNGTRKYVWLLLGVARGNGKTPLASGLGYEALLSNDDAPQVYTVAGSKDQAAIGMDFARSWREDSPELSEWTNAGPGRVSCAPTRGRWRILSSDGRLGHGRNVTRGIVDEWHVFETRREEQVYIALASSLHKRGGDLIAITTAGYDKSSQLGVNYDEMLKAPKVTVSRDGCVTVAEDLEARKLMIWIGAPEELELDRDAILAGEHDKLLRACNPLSSLPIEAIRGQFALLPFDEACRLHLNRWTKAKDIWISAGTWNRLRSDVQIPAGTRIWVAVDAAKTRDTTAVVWAAWVDGRIVLRSRVWSCIADKPAHVHVPGDRIPNRLPREFISNELARDYRVEEVVFDPRYFDSEAEELDELGLLVAEFPQNSPAMADAWTHFDEAIGEKAFSHDADRVFADHVTSASAVWTERGWKVFKTKQHRPIDALVAAAMARERASRAGENPPVPWTQVWN